MYGETVGAYNVDLYEDLVLSHETGDEYYMVVLTKFNAEDREVGRKRFYILNGNYGKIEEQLRNEATLDKMFECPENRRFRYVEVDVIKTVKEGQLV